MTTPEQYVADFQRGFSYQNLPTLPALPSDFCVGVAGAGLMGATIAAAFLRADVSIAIYDPVEGARDSVKERIRVELQEHYARTEQDSNDALERRLARLRVIDSLEELAQTKTIIESIPEKLNLKKKFYKQLGASANESITILTNTSSLRIEDLAQGLSADPCAFASRARFCAFHFFHPVASRPLVEIAPNASTAPETLALAVKIVERIGKLPLVVGDGPGLLVNRLLQAYLNEALKLLDSNIEPERLERICKEIGFDAPPLRIIDEIGVDVSIHAGYSFLKAFPDRTYNSATLAGLMRNARLGRKSKRGFYRYASALSWTDDATLDVDRDAIVALRNDADVPIDNLPEDASKKSDEELKFQILTAILNEAKELLKDRIARDFREIDASLVCALGFPKALGGIGFWAKERGLAGDLAAVS